MVLGADAEAVLVLLVKPEDRELDSTLIPAVEDEVLALSDLLYRVPRYPGLVGTSSVPSFFDSIITTRPMVGRNCGSDCVHNNPICMHNAA